MSTQTIQTKYQVDTIIGASLIPQWGEIYEVDLSPVVGSEQGGKRPVVILQNNVGNKYSPTVIVAAITSKQQKNKIPTHVDIVKGTCGLPQDSVVLLEQMRTIDKKRLNKRLGMINILDVPKIKKGMLVSLGMAN